MTRLAFATAYRLALFWVGLECYWGLLLVTARTLHHSPFGSGPMTFTVLGAVFFIGLVCSPLFAIPLLVREARRIEAERHALREAAYRRKPQ